MMMSSVLIELVVSILCLSLVTAVPPNELKTECCNKGIYIGQSGQECAFEEDPTDPVAYSVLTPTEKSLCRQSFLDCCNSYSQTRFCNKGISQALNSSFCPYVLWDPSPTVEEKTSRSCCESCLRGVHDNENAAANNTPRHLACPKTLKDFNTSHEYSVYLDCCNRRIGRSFGGRLSNIELENEESEAVSRSSGMQAYSRRNLPLQTGGRTTSSDNPLGEDKPCSAQNHCAHFCIDTDGVVPKHCACRKGYFLAEDGGSCRMLSMRYTTTGGYRTMSPYDPCIFKPSSPQSTPSTFRSPPGKSSDLTAPPAAAYTLPTSPGQTISREEVRETHSYRTEVTDLGGGKPVVTTVYHKSSVPDHGVTQLTDSELHHRAASCPLGYTFSPTSHSCVDVDECQRHPCGGNEQCINYDGGFYCRRVTYYDSDYNSQKHVPPSLDTSFRTGPSTTCESGLIYNHAKGYCVDDDECEKHLHNCRDNEFCRNTYRNYTCDCKRGYRKDGAGNCIDIDECSELHYTVCPKHESICLNTPGSYRCLCKEGFESSGGGEQTSCVDIDECARRPGICGQDGICLNTYGSYKCRCQPGFELSPDGTRCRDLDECNSGGRRCIGRCENVPGSFRCTCPPGFKLDSSQRICEDIDECSEGRNTCHSGEKCLNTMGEYKCYSINCPSGYYQDPNRENRCIRRQIKQVYDTQTQVVRYEPNAPHYITYNYLTLACNLTDYDKPFYDFDFDRSGNTDYDFRIRVLNVNNPPNVVPANDNSFRIVRKGRAGASVHLNQPLKGPQDIDLEFSVVNRLGEVFYKSFITIYVARYDGVNF